MAAKERMTEGTAEELKKNLMPRVATTQPHLEAGDLRNRGREKH